MNNIFNSIFLHWKSTLRGAVTAIASICATLVAVKANPNVDPELLPLLNMMPSRWMVYIGLVAAIVRLCTGAFSKDADKQLANVPGKEDPQVVPAHPIPDDPKNKAVVSALLLLLALPLLSGCVRATANAPAVAPDPYTRAASAVNDAMLYGRLAQDTEITLYKSGLIDKDAHGIAQRGFLKLAEIEPEITSLIRQQASADTIRAKLWIALVESQQIAAEIKISDPQKAATFSNLMLLIDNSFTSIAALLTVDLKAELNYGFQATGGFTPSAIARRSGGLSGVPADRASGRLNGYHFRGVLFAG